VDDVAEGLLKSKKYVVPLALLSPVTVGSIAVLYFTEGRFNLKKDTNIFDIELATHPQFAREQTFTPAPAPLDSSR
jgi:hypothetical protein